ncbi:hypothetical protein [Pontiella agarivorans]|uniref:Uncharacterized protein n=1 Tax=Pontiella agarivorans TaxID=3038953 RepID=A0ABU5MWS9_9BACT|nr:hypothetical protein [Pontiella agarivorans]MDZ8118655.1 hypothetical protein [Pontiella agarivorans]
MNIEALKTMSPMVWIILAAAAFISVTVIFNKAIKVLLKLAAIGVVLLFALYFLVQANVISLPTFGN